MNRKKLIQIGVTLSILGGLLAGCSGSNEGLKPAAPSLIETLRQVKKSVTLELQAERADKKITVKVVLKNPDRKSITSVQSWLAFNPDQLKGLKVSADDSAFSLPAPYTQTVDNTRGLVMIGRASAAPVTDAVINVATVEFQALKNVTSMIDVFDYADSLSGHASVNTIQNGIPVNLLKKPESPALVIKKS